MHSVLVVDDEPFVRLSLASLKNWQQEGFALQLGLQQVVPGP